MRRKTKMNTSMRHQPHRKPNGGGRRGQRGRHNNPRGRVFEGKTRQQAEQLKEKYTAMAHDTLAQGDRVEAENYWQHADHYQRIVNHFEEQDRQMEAAAAFEEDMWNESDDNDSQVAEESVNKGDERQSRGRANGRSQDESQASSEALETSSPYSQREAGEADPLVQDSPEMDSAGNVITMKNARPPRRKPRMVGGDQSKEVSDEMEQAPRRRGRPRKSESVDAAHDVASDGDESKRRRGRPRKSESIEAANEEQGDEMPKRRRGRPRKTEISDENAAG